MDKNIFFNTDKLTENEEVTISYMGYLFEKGSDEVYLHFGFGPKWEGASEIKMDKSEFGFQCSIPSLGKGSLELCFRDGNGEWDNRFGQNFSFPIEKATENVEEVSEESIEIESTKENDEVQEIVEEIEKIDVVDEVMQKAQDIIAKAVGKDELSAIMYEIENFKPSPEYEEAVDFAKYPEFVIGEEEIVTPAVAEEVQEEAKLDIAAIKEEVAEDHEKVINFDIEELFNQPVTEIETVEEFDEMAIPDDFTDPKQILALITTDKKENSLTTYGGVSKFYLWKKKISIAMYKFFRYVPRLLAQNFKEENSDE